MNSFDESKKLLTRASKVLAGGVSSEFRKYNHPHALFYKEAKGSQITDVDGNTYLDFTLSQGPLILGHSHPRVLQAVNSYSEEGQLYAGQHIQEIELAEKIVELIPSAELIRFCLDGSEAVQTAFRVARAKTGKNKFLRFEGHYHGWLDNVAWGISTPGIEALGSREDPACFAWSKGISPDSRAEFIVLPWNDLELLKATVEKHKDELAAIITEPVMCNNGCIAPKPGFLAGIRELCSQYGIAFILDEVITGFRLGLGGAQAYYNITPDLSIFAKAMGSGYPISAIVGKNEWMDCIANSEVIHAGTMNASNPTIAASLATIRVLEEEQPYERMFRLGQQLMQGIAASAEKHGQNLKVFGLGPMFVTLFTDLDTLTDYRDTLAADKAKLGKFIARLQDQGIRVIGRGLWYISAVHTEAEIEQAIEAVDQVLREF
ncbi:aspartate aminotransferase family protein [Sphingobacterium humi]|uniref:Aminotransferase class III-fold pyridoxal phosphate-dependent enzyme n=1 Tax=Sphingobacterium humi TaxID=1796905 RepID=A0A6N8KZQ4_9SPHI|nr:aspartate aminotransferase family protein [Sphingobacterium humi]MVZ62566.1 aminotransferase class III-fold pyridoxal phosphate-dependent enzyme [Sphingobacterium humi]